jgi:RNA polymerase sigma factor (sigma-70 family)
MTPRSPTDFSKLLHDGGPRGDAAWREFMRVNGPLMFEIYGPLIAHYLRRRGVQAVDAEDLTQDVFVRMFSAIRPYDPRRGPFRNWLFSIVKRVLIDSWRRQRHRDRGSGDTDVQDLLEQQPERTWNREYDQRLLTWAAEKVRGSFRGPTFQAFWMREIDGRPVEEVARELGISQGAVYVAKHRVLEKVKAELRRVADDR